MKAQHRDPGDKNAPVAWSIRRPRGDELDALRAIEREAGALFREVGMADIAAHEPASIDELTRYLDDDRVWVLVDDGVAAGSALVDLVDGIAHLEQLSVAPAYGRRGHGAALLAHVVEWARQRGLGAVTLTTFEHVPWNAPYYRRHGFRILSDDELGPGLRRRRDLEAEHGLDPRLRVCMRREV